MDLIVHAPLGMRSDQSLRISGSKSESNRLLVLQALFPTVELENLGIADDVVAMQNGLSGASDSIDIGHAGTTMRFLTAYLASIPSQPIILTGSPRMKERPIKVLVDALRQMGAEIEYLNEEGFPPLRISGRTLAGKKVQISADISSQYISALLLIAPSLPEGLTIELEGEITSRPYIEMTLALLSRLGFVYDFSGNTIRIPKQELKETRKITVESDWSSASYYFSLVALSKPGTMLNLSSYYADSLQGDRAVVEMYSLLGVSTSFSEKGLQLLKIDRPLPETITLDLCDTPDLAQTLAVSCFGLGIKCDLTGLHTLKIKETDRLLALQTELGKLGAEIRVTKESLHLESAHGMLEHIAIDTYHDHRMAMAFAPLGMLHPIIIRDAAVVSKSYPEFWDHLEKVGVQSTKC